MDKHTIDFKRYACVLSENENGSVRADMKASPKSGEWYRREDVIRLQKRLLKIIELVEKDVVGIKISCKPFLNAGGEVMSNMSRVGINARAIKELLRNTERKIEIQEEQKEGRFKAIRRHHRKEREK